MTDNPTPKPKPVHLVIDTLGAVADDGYSFNLWCLGCERGELILSEPVRQKLGSDHSLDLRGKFRCSKCGSKDIEIRLSPPHNPPDDRMW